MKFLKWLIKKISTPLGLILVWFFSIRPFSDLIHFIESVSTIDISKVIQKNGISDVTLGAIDVAVLMLIFDILKDFITKALKKPSEIKVEVINHKNDQNFASIKYNPSIPEKSKMLPVKLKIKASINPQWLWVFDYVYRGIRIKINWHAEWLSVTPQFYDTSVVTDNSRPGEIYINIVQLLSESDKETRVDGELYIMVNRGFKRDGYINSKIEVNSNSWFIRFMFNWTLSLLVKKEIVPCKIFLEIEGD